MSTNNYEKQHRNRTMALRLTSCALAVLLMALVTGCGGGEPSGDLVFDSALPERKDLVVPAGGGEPSGDLVFDYGWDPKKYLRHALFFDDSGMVEKIMVTNTDEKRTHELIRGEHFELRGDAPTDQEIEITTLESSNMRQDVEIRRLRTMSGVFSCFLEEKRRYIRLGEKASLIDRGPMVALEKVSGRLPEVARLDADYEGNPYTGGEDLSGTTVTILGHWREVNAYRFEEAMAPFEHVTGIDVVYHAHETSNVPREFASRVKEDRLPDIVEIASLDLLQSLVRDGSLHDAADMVGMDWLEQHYDRTWIDLSKVESVHAGVWYWAVPDGLVSYNRPVFDSEGYEVPRTWQEMLDLSDRMVSDGHTPWVIHLGDDGLFAPQWLNHVMIRIHPPEVYDRWAAGDLPFDSPEVSEAIQYLEEIWFNEDYVLGGRANLVNGDLRFGPEKIVGDNPAALMLFMSPGLVRGLLPSDGHEFTDTVGLFPLPPVDPDTDHPRLVWGTLQCALDGRPEVRAAMRYLATGLSTHGWLAMSGEGATYAGIINNSPRPNGFVSPHKDTPLERYRTPAERFCAEILRGSDSLRRSTNLIPDEVMKAFGSQMDSYISRYTSVDDAATVLRNVEEVRSQ